MERLAVEMEVKAKGDIARAVANVSEAYHANERELREEIDEINQQHATRLEKMSIERDNALGELRAECDHRVESLSAAHVTEIERLTTSHRERVKMKDDEHEKQLKQSMSEAVTLAVREVEAQHDAREADRAEKAASDHARELKRATDEYERDLERLEREYETKLESCIAVSTTLELERESLRSQLRRAREELSAAELERTIEVEKSRDAAVATAYAHENEIDSLHKEHKVIIARMQEVNESAARTANEALSASRAEVSKWRAMYETRESRPEDVRRIKNLETELHDAHERLERSAQHRRTLQSELLGRANDFGAATPRKRGGLSLKRAHAAYATAPT
jgi:DNA repair exonuclease SbcCD ATPase subunit